MFQFRETATELGHFILGAEDVRGGGLDFIAQPLSRRLALLNPGLEHVELVAGELSIEVLEFLGNLLVAARLAGLALQGADLAFDLPDQVSHAQKVLLGVLRACAGLLCAAICTWLSRPPPRRSCADPRACWKGAG